MMMCLTSSQYLKKILLERSPSPVAVGDSAENYSFIVQDAAEGSTGTISKPQYIHLCAVSRIQTLQQVNFYTSTLLLSLTALTVTELES
jgi:hypothetical protein